MKLQVFMYLLMRDYVTPGVVARVVQEVEALGDKEATFTNTHLAAYAKELIDRLV